MGKNDLNTAEHILGNCFFLQILISIILTVILLFGNRTFLLAFGASENTIEYAVNYMNIYAVGTIFVQLTLGMNMFITTQGFAKTGMPVSYTHLDVYKRQSCNCSGQSCHHFCSLRCSDIHTIMKLICS